MSKQQKMWPQEVPVDDALAKRLGISLKESYDMDKSNLFTISVSSDGDITLTVSHERIQDADTGKMKALDPATILALIEAIIQIINLLKGFFGKK